MAVPVANCLDIRIMLLRSLPGTNSSLRRYLRPYPEFVKAFGHNGFFKSLEEIVHFYNTRDVESWPAPEYPDTMNTDELGNLGLTAEEEAAIVAFMKKLSDGYILD